MVQYCVFKMFTAGGLLVLLLSISNADPLQYGNATGLVRAKRGIPFTGVTIDGANKFVEGHGVPLTIDLDAPVEDKQLVRISGTLNSNYGSLNVYLTQSHGHDNEYTPFHLSVRSGGVAVLNTMQDGAWETESHFAHFLDAGKKFVIHVRCRIGQFEVYLNFVKVYEYHNMFSLGVIKQIAVEGDAVLQRVEWGGGSYQLPYSQMYSPMKEGRVMITGESYNDFALSLINSNLDKPFYLQARYDLGTIVTNSATNSKMNYQVEWGNEEKARVQFPFLRGELFEITIMNSPEHLTVFHNDNEVMTFRHRVDDHMQDYHGVWVGPIYELWNVVWN